MKKELAIGLLLLSLIMISTTTLEVSATDYTKVGVKVGDTADYSFTSSTGNGIIHIQILQIIDANVTIKVRTLYANGTEGPINIITGNLSANRGTLVSYLIAANLGKGDTAVPERPEYMIDNTTTVIITGLNRTVNHSCHFMAIVPAGRQWAYEYYWDKATGLAVKINRTTWGGDPDPANDSWGRILFSNYTATLISTTAFTAQNATQDTTALLASVGAIAALLATITIAAIMQKRYPNRH